MDARPRAATVPHGAPQDLPAHNLPLAALGVFILWLGWFGFNAGSTTAGTASIALIATNTFLAAGAGSVGATITTSLRTGVARVPMALNGVLGGLGSITDGCATLAPEFAALAGLIAGSLVVYGTYAIERIADDPVGAVAVHGLCGAWGTLAAGLFNVGTFSVSQGGQLIGIGAAFAWTFPTSTPRSCLRTPSWASRSLQRWTPTAWISTSTTPLRTLTSRRSRPNTRKHTRRRLNTHRGRRPAVLRVPRGGRESVFASGTLPHAHMDPHGESSLFWAPVVVRVHPENKKIRYGSAFLYDLYAFYKNIFSIGLTNQRK